MPTVLPVGLDTPGFAIAAPWLQLTWNHASWMFEVRSLYCSVRFGRCLMSSPFSTNKWNLDNLALFWLCICSKAASFCGNWNSRAEAKLSKAELRWFCLVFQNLRQRLRHIFLRMAFSLLCAECYRMLSGCDVLIKQL